MEIMNIFLLSKWKWGILTEDEAIWSDILTARCENAKRKVLIGDISVVEKNDSIWWRDLLISDNFMFLQDHSFANAVLCKIRSGNHVPFRYGYWTGAQNLL